MSTDATILTARHLHKTYRLGRVKVPVLHGVDLDVTRGEWLAVLGASGSGKSTLLHLLGALDRPDSGTIEVAGIRIDTLNEKAATRYRRRGIGIVFQSYNLVPTMTAAEVLSVSLPFGPVTVNSTV